MVAIESAAAADGLDFFADYRVFGHADNRTSARPALALYCITPHAELLWIELEMSR
jgi:hypothetical protein